MYNLLKKIWTKPPLVHTKKYDEALTFVVLGLLLFSLTMVYSASIAVAEHFSHTGNPYYYLYYHAVSIVIAMTIGWIAFCVPLRIWEQYATPIFGVALLLLVLVLVPGIGHTVNGSRRWITLLWFHIQPSELMKFACVLYTASYLIRKQTVLDNIQRGFLPAIAPMLLIGVLLLLEPDFGALVVIIVIIFCLLFLGGVNGWVFSGSILLALVTLILLILIEPYRMRRVLGFIAPFDDPYDKGYQLTNSLIAFGLGKWSGMGLGGGIQKLAYLPEPHTDFIMAVIAEEFGVIGVCLLITTYAWIVWRTFRIGEQARKLERYYGALVAKGIGIWIGLQAFLNMGVSMGILPTKGMTMPLMSFGGSALVANLVALCIVLRVDWENKRIMHGYYKVSS
ncbi:MAG: putative lipid II flippase FtsW [Neisseriales bacterium]|nr:MAG: putative lipid II flippase FtsW [Neisseriales bacterium]